MNPEQPKPIAAFENVALAFGEHEVLRGLNLQLKKGESTAIIGESGCGKTVLLKLLIGLLMPTSGRVRFDDRLWTLMSEKEVTQNRLRFGFLFQGAALFDSMTVFDNVAFPLRQHTGKTENEIVQTVRKRLEEVGLPIGVESRKPAELSGGMKKRVGLARAIALDPELILYDEPTTGLDPVMGGVIIELIGKTSRSSGVTGVVVTHDLRTVESVAQRVVMLQPLSRVKNGESQIVFDGGVADLMNSTAPRVLEFVQGSSA